MQKHLTKEDVIGEIRQSRRHPTGKKYIWILVEGKTDQTLYKKLVNENVKVQWVYGGGLKNLRDALLEFINETNQVIGIRDADFLHLNNKRETIKNLFLTDYHDAEMTLIFCDIVFQSLVDEYLLEQRVKFDSLRNSLLISLAFLGGIRWINDAEDLGLNFDVLGLSNFYSAANLTLDKAKCIQEIETRSSKKKRAINAEEIESKIAETNDYYNLNNGHDVVKAFALHVTAINGGKGIKDDEIARALRVAYRKEDFALTALYASLKNWEQQTGYTLF